MRKFFTIILLVICFLIFGLYLFFFPPLPLSPPISRDLPYTDNYDFTARVNKIFPIGTSGEKFRKELSKQGFIVAREPVYSDLFAGTKFGKSTEKLYSILVSNGYLNKEGEFQDKFFEIKNYNELNLGPENDSNKKEIFGLLSIYSRIWGARFTKPQFPCELHCIIIWRENTNGNAEYISSNLGRTCL